MNSFSPDLPSEATSSDESGVTPLLPHLVKAFPDTRQLDHTSDTILPLQRTSALPGVEEIRCSFVHQGYCCSATTDTVTDTQEHPSSPWFRSGSTTSSQSSIMDLSKMVFSGLDDQDDPFLLLEDEPSSNLPITDPGKVPHPASPHVPSVTQIWSNSQKRLETLLSRVIDRDGSSGTSLNSLDAENLPQKVTQSTPALLADHVPKMPSLPPGRLEGLLSKALDSAVISSRSNSNSNMYSSAHTSASFASCPPPIVGLNAPHHLCPPESSDATRCNRNKRVKVEQLPLDLPAFNHSPPAAAGNSMLLPHMAPGHVAAPEGSFRHVGSGSSWAPGGAMAGFPPSASVPVSCGKISGSDEEEECAWDDGSAFPKSWSLDQNPDGQPGSRKRAHVGKKRVASERNRRGKIREGLHQLREVMNGQNDYAATLLEAVAYIKSLQEEVRELKASKDNSGQ